jgi:hypothetical protein
VISVVSKHILYLTNDQLVALMIEGKSIVGRNTFAIGDLTTDAFADFVSEHKDTATHVVTDLIEEDFRLDTIPHLRGSDQEAVLARKLSQIYRASPFRHAIVQGRLEEGRRDDRVFYHAVTNPDSLKQVLTVLEASKVPIEGVHSSAVLSSRLLKELDIFFPHTLLVTIVPDFGLRQTYFQNKQIRFSRLTPIIYDETQTVGELIAAETSRTWQYLDSLRNFASGDSLEVCLLVHDRDKVMLQDAIRTYPLLRYRFLDINEVAQKLGVTPAPTSSHADEILSHLYSRGGIENHFADATQTRFSVFRRARHALTTMTIGVLTAGVIGAAFNLYQASRVSGVIDERSTAQRALQAEYQKVAAAIQQQKMTTDAVRDSSVFYNAQIRPSPAAPGDMLRDVAIASSPFDRIRIVQLGWSVGGDPNLPLALTATGIGQAGDTASVIPNAPGAQATPAAQAPADANPPLAAHKYQAMLIEAEITPYDGNLRTAILEVERYVARLNEIPNTKAAVVAMPVDITPKVGLKVSDNAPRDGANFIVRLVRTVRTT